MSFFSAWPSTWSWPNWSTCPAECCNRSGLHRTVSDHWSASRFEHRAVFFEFEANLRPLLSFCLTGPSWFICLFFKMLIRAMWSAQFLVNCSSSSSPPPWWKNSLNTHLSFFIMISRQLHQFAQLLSPPPPHPSCTRPLLWSFWWPANQTVQRQPSGMFPSTCCSTCNRTSRTKTCRSYLDPHPDHFRSDFCIRTIFWLLSSVSEHWKPDLTAFDHCNWPLFLQSFSFSLRSARPPAVDLISVRFSPFAGISRLIAKRSAFLTWRRLTDTTNESKPTNRQDTHTHTHEFVTRSSTERPHFLSYSLDPFLSYYNRHNKYWLLQLIYNCSSWIQLASL